MDHQCKDCKAEHEAYTSWCLGGPDTEGAAEPPTPSATVRPATPPGPRCATHHRARKKRERDGSHARRLTSVYGITADTYAQLKEYQGGVCWICRRAKGTYRRLAVDHDHSCCAGKTSCGNCVRGLLCGPCNDILAHLRDDTAAASRIVFYLRRPPYQRMLAERGVDGES